MPDIAVVELSRWQFAATALYHFLFVPLTLGLSFLLAAMETVYVTTGRPIYKQMAQFWGKLFMINFALGVATGLTMEFQFGTNWSFYSSFVGAVIDQRTTLFNASLLDNLLLAAPQATAAQIERAVHEAQLDAFVCALPQGYETVLGEGGSQVSGGEARRIAIARALLQDSPVLVLDEPTEGLDAQTAALLYRALESATRGRSVLLITHRLEGLAALVDRVVVMSGGRIVEESAVTHRRGV